MAVIGGAGRYHFLAFDLPHSGWLLCCGLSGGDVPKHSDGHNAAFAFFGGVPQIHPVRQHQAGGCPDSGRWEAAANARLHGASGATICASRQVLAELFRARASDKQVYGLVVRLHPRNFLGPRPACRELRGPRLDALDRTVPPAPGGAAAGLHKARPSAQGVRAGSSSSLAIADLLPMMPAISALDGRVRCRWCVTASNDYRCPWPTATVSVLIRGYIDEVVISCGAEVIAQHRRSYDSEDLMFDPLSDWVNITGLDRAEDRRLDQAAPLAGWDLPEAEITLRRLRHGSRMGKAASASTSRCSVYWSYLPARGGRGCGKIWRRPAASCPITRASL